jgi:hypothetical protein
VSGGWITPGGSPPGDRDPVGPDPGAGWSTAPPRPAWGDYSAPPTAPRPGVVPLRPLTVGELLDGAFTTIRRYPAATLGLAALTMLVVTATQVIASYYLLRGVDSTSASGNLSGDYLSRSLTVDLIVLIVTLFASLVLSGAITAVVGQAVLGRPMSGGEAWRAAMSRLVPLLVVSLIILFGSLLILGLSILPGILVAVLASDGVGIALVAGGGLISFVLVVWVAVMLWLATPAVVLEKQGAIAALRRSRALVAGSWWRVFGIVLLAAVLAQIVSGIIVVPFALGAGHASLFSGKSAPVDFSSLLITGIGSFIAGTIVRPFSAGVVALLYIDRRMRAEALDLTLQQAATSDGR